MAAHSRKRLFEELGLLNEPEQANPYEVLGLAPEFANDLLKEDSTGAVVRLAAGALYKALSRRYHPDVPKTGDEARFRKIDHANTLIEKAEPASLTRWSKVDKVVQPAQIKQMQTERALLVDRATELFQANLELGNHPQHFSQLEWAQGALLQRVGVPLLLRQLPERGVRITKGYELDIDKAKLSDTMTQAFDFSRFLRQNELFGLEPGAGIVAYMNEDQRASILAPDLSFVMDITDPVAKYRKKRKSQHDASGNAGLWSRLDDPVLFITNVPSRYGAKYPETQIFTFPDRVGTKDKGVSTAWELPMEVVGTVADQKFFSRVKNARAAGAAAISGGDRQRTMSHFKLVTTPARKFIEDDPGYSPLLARDSLLVLYDTASKMPVITDVRMLGMIGSNSKAV